MCHPVDPATYDPAAAALASHAQELGASRKQKHKTMIADYERLSWSRGIDPKVVTAVTASHVANFYKKRLDNFELFEWTAKAISAAMTVYFARLGCSGAWQTGLDADNRPTFTGHPNQSEVVKEMKQDHLKAVATEGHVTMPVDPFEIGHAAAYCDEHIAGEVNVDPQRLADLCLADTSMGLILGLDEATKIKYETAEGTRSGIFFHVFLNGFFSVRVCARCGEAAPDDHLCSLPIDFFWTWTSVVFFRTIHRREHVRISRDALGNLAILVDIREKAKNGLHGQRYRLESWPGVAGDPRVDPVLLMGAYLLLRGERKGYLFCSFTKDRNGHIFVDESKRLDAKALLSRSRSNLTVAGVDSAEWIGTHSFKRGGVQLLRQLGVEDCAIMARGR